MKIRTFDLPKYEDWFNNRKNAWRQKLGRYYCSTGTIEVLGKRYYYVEITCRGYPGYVDYIYNDAIKISKSEKKIKKWYKKTVLKANRAWRKELKSFFIK